jgi:transposase
MRDASEHRHGVRQAWEPCVVIFALLREKWLCQLLLRWASCADLMRGQLLTDGSVRLRRWPYPRAKVDTDAWKARRSCRTWRHLQIAVSCGDTVEC